MTADVSAGFGGTTIVLSKVAWVSRSASCD
jgi:hypothetical protein